MRISSRVFLYGMFLSVSAMADTKPLPPSSPLTSAPAGVPASVMPQQSITVLTSGASLTSDAIGKVVATKEGNVEYCYENELEEKPTLKGKIVVKFTIGMDGRVVRVKTDSSTMNDLPTETCINYHVAKMKFPLPISKPIEVVYPVSFNVTENSKDILVSLDDKPTINQGLTAAQALDTVRSSLPQIQYCYEGELRESQEMQTGNVVTSVAIDASGKVTDVNPQPSTLQNAFARSCISGVYRKMQFQKPTTTSVIATFKVTFYVKPSAVRR